MLQNDNAHVPQSEVHEDMIWQVVLNLSSSDLSVEKTFALVGTLNTPQAFFLNISA